MLHKNAICRLHHQVSSIVIRFPGGENLSRNRQPKRQPNRQPAHAIMYRGASSFPSVMIRFCSTICASSLSCSCVKIFVNWADNVCPIGFRKFPCQLRRRFCGIVATASRQFFLQKPFFRNWFPIFNTDEMLCAIYAQYAQYTRYEIPLTCFLPALSSALLTGHTGRICRSPSGSVHLCLLK